MALHNAAPTADSVNAYAVHFDRNLCVTIAASDAVPRAEAGALSHGVSHADADACALFGVLPPPLTLCNRDVREDWSDIRIEYCIRRVAGKHREWLDRRARLAGLLGCGAGSHVLHELIWGLPLQIPRWDFSVCT